MKFFNNRKILKIILTTKIFFLSAILCLFFMSCSYTGRTLKTANRHIPMNTEISINIINVDVLPDSLYKIVRFYYKEKDNRGVILIKMTDDKNIIPGEKLNVTLCDVLQFSELSARNDTVEMFSQTGENNKKILRKEMDTINFRGDFMLNAQFVIRKHFVLDFSDNALEPIFEICN